ncbi:hypothetical protein DFQ27_005428 [Actinomortierella ambigua]|uniref:Uncharacterized protein n=1 Tax=Actinomortierella ambigua TaxID=1343610 RepID=A0A9P6Q092_9FUNG|nr:hypothetical protein DFQ27_005428 [Actinomortierella ambigua]
MKRIYHDRGIDRDEQDGDHHGGGGGGRERIVISTIDDPSMDDDMVEGLDRESVFVASTAALEEEGDHQHHDRHHRQQTKQRLEKQKPEHHVEEMKKTAGSRSNSVHLQGSMEEGDHDPSSRVAMPVPPSASSSSSSSSSYSSQPASQSSTTSRRSHPQGPLLDPDRPRWTEAGRRAVEELRGISMEKEEGEEEEQGEGEGGKNETTDQSRHATADHAESMTVAKAMKHKAEEKEEGEEEEDKKKEEREGGASVLWSIRASKRAKILHHGRSAYLRSGRNQAMSNVVVPASSSSTMSMAGLATGSGSLAAAAEGRVPGSLWLRDIAQTRQERLAPPRLPNKVAIMDLLDRDMDPMGGFYPSENAALQVLNLCNAM